MIAPIRELQQLVLEASHAESYPCPRDPFLARILSALRFIREDSAGVGPADLAALVRQGILRCHLGRGEQPELRVPSTAPWPDDATWRLFGCDARLAGVGHFLIQAQRWEPTWLDGGAPAAVEAALREEDRRQSRVVVADPPVTEYTGFDHYATPGQREAVRSSFLMPPGSTVVVNLPTGGGKTLAFQLPALVWAADGGLVLVITPTISLARDQEDRFRALLERHPQGRAWTGVPLAYHSGLDENSKTALREAIRHGALPILFASPEAALGALRAPLFDAARNGRIRVFAVDEAHVVSQWGQQFRPEFQSLAGLRDALLRVSPPASRFRTLLFTATLTAESLQTLRIFFGREGYQLVSEAALRPEPAFLLCSVEEEDQRTERVVEAVRHLPRPIILYTTQRDHAEKWFHLLRAVGFRRLRLVRGGDLAELEGERVLQDWRTRAMDLIVATSAFGLGVDQAEIRSVLHACLPETIDRFYQEVGRAGRDGKAAISLLISTPTDVEVARGLAQERIISTERGFERWDAMWAQVRGRPREDGSYVVSLDDRPPDLPVPGRRNASWNLRTLVLMARAGLIEFAAHPPPMIEPMPGEDEAALEQRRRETLDRFSQQVAVTITDQNHARKAHWDRLVEQTRSSLRAADQREYQLVCELRDPRRPINDIFREVYTLDDPPVRPPRLLGSCVVTRRQGAENFRSVEPELMTLVRTAARLAGSLEQALAPCRDEGGRAWIACDIAPSGPREARRWRERILTLLRYAVAGGIVEVALPDGLLDEEGWRQLAARAPLRFIIRATMDPPLTAPLTPELPVPRLTLLVEHQLNPEALMRVMQVHRPSHLIVLPRDVADPDRPYRRLLDVIRHLSIDDVLTRLAG